MIKLTQTDGKSVYITKEAISKIEMPLAGFYPPSARSLINGSFAVQETIEQIMELIK